MNLPGRGRLPGRPDEQPALALELERRLAPGGRGSPRRRADPASTLGRLVLVAAIALVAFNLRSVVTSVSPVLLQVQRSMGLSSPVAGLLTTVPLVAFGVCALAAPVLARRYGIEATLVGTLSVLVVAILIRSVPSPAGLFAGTAIIGVAVGLGNVLVPALIKRDLPAHVRLGTAVYSVALAAGSAVAAGATVPVEDVTGTGWPGALALWAVPVVLSLAMWLPRLADAHRDVEPVRLGGRLWRDPLAWHVTVYMGLQSLGFYALLAWLPTIFEQHHVAPSTAGLLLSVAGFASIPAAFAAPLVSSTTARQRATVTVAVGLNVVALVGMVWSPLAAPFLWMVVLGLARGSIFALALSFIVLRSSNAEQAAELSGMAQTVGYLVAAVGPFAMGALRQATGSWVVPLLAVMAVLGPQLISGFGASRPLTVGSRPAPGAAD